MKKLALVFGLFALSSGMAFAENCGVTVQNAVRNRVTRNHSVMSNTVSVSAGPGMCTEMTANNTCTYYAVATFSVLQGRNPASPQTQIYTVETRQIGNTEQCSVVSIRTSN